VGPRLFGIPAAEAPVVAVLRRGPSGWFHVGRWQTDVPAYEPGAWLHGTLYPQRCDLSPDGRWLVYFALKANARWALGGTYVAVSRLPWLTALAGWGTDGTWTSGFAFVPRGTARHPPTAPDIGDIGPLLARYELDQRLAGSFAVERARGWTETPDSPPRTEADIWDERRVDRVTMQKPRPGDPSVVLAVRGWYAAHRGLDPRRGPARYRLVHTPRDGAPRETPLDGVGWADWTGDGRLLVATETGALQVREGRPLPVTVTWTADLAALSPARTLPPEDAARW
jgi:hypothetical protein